MTVWPDTAERSNPVGLCEEFIELFSANEFSALVHDNMAPSQDIVSITPPLEEPSATLSAPSSQISVALSDIDFQSSTPPLSPRLIASPLLNNFRPPPVITDGQTSCRVTGCKKSYKNLDGWFRHLKGLHVDDLFLEHLVKQSSTSMLNTIVSRLKYAKSYLCIDCKCIYKCITKC